MSNNLTPRLTRLERITHTYDLLLFAPERFEGIRCQNNDREVMSTQQRLVVLMLFVSSLETGCVKCVCATLTLSLLVTVKSIVLRIIFCDGP